MDQKNGYPDLNNAAPSYPQSQQPFIAQPMMMPNQQIIVQTPLSHGPQQMVCPSCQSQIMTKVEFKANTKTHIIAALLCIFCFYCCCSCCPYCVKSMQSAQHSCPKCGHFIGIHEA